MTWRGTNPGPAAPMPGAWEYSPPGPWKLQGGPGGGAANPPAMLDFSRPRIFGVLNVTPDSFSDGGRFLAPEDALAQARRMVAEGADVIDVGGASSHPQAAPVTPDEELRRLRSVLPALVEELGKTSGNQTGGPVPISIDTQHPKVAEACLAMGAHIINDVSGMTDNAMARVAAAHGAPMVLTYNNFTVPKEASGLSFLSDMLAFFDERLEEAAALGLERVILDPGYGFGKSLQENLILLRSLHMLGRFGRPVLICTSRKGSLGRLTGEAVPSERLGASLATTLFAITQGAVLARVHDVKAFHQALTAWWAIEALRGEDGPGGGDFA